MNPDVERLATLSEAPTNNRIATTQEPEVSEGLGARKSGGITPEQLVALAKDSGLHLFHDQFQEAYAWVVVHHSHQSLKIQGKRFQQWLLRLGWTTLKKAPSREAVLTATQILAACARFDGPEYVLGTRVMRTSEAIWYDLGSTVVRITAGGWEEIPEPYPLFLRYAHQRSQVAPVRGGDIRSFLPLVNLPDCGSTLSSDQLLLLVSVVLMVVPDIARPVICIHAEQGAGKTTLMRMVRDLIDPSVTPTLAAPDSPREFVQLAAHHYLVFLDNLSTLPEWLSDGICRCVTGEGFSKRELFSDDEDVIYSFRRSIGLNGINLVPSKPDLLDRALILSLERIPDTHRQTEAQLWDTFHALKPKLLGAVLALVSQVLANVGTVTISRAPRLVDFATYGVAAANALGLSKEVFLTALAANSQAQTAEALEASPVAQALLVFLEHKLEWNGSASELLKELNAIADRAGVDQKSRLWPKEARWVWRRIKEVRPNLLAAGCQADHREVNGKSRIELSRRSPENDPGVPTDPKPLPSGGDQSGDISIDQRAIASTVVGPNPLDHGPSDHIRDTGIISQDSAGVDSTGWPIELQGLGLREQASYQQCHSCPQGTWQRYGGLPLCKHHALQALAFKKGPKTLSQGCDGTIDATDEANHEKGVQTDG